MRGRYSVIVGMASPDVVPINIPSVGLSQTTGVVAHCLWGDAMAMLEALGIPKQNVLFSDATTEEMWVEGGKYGSVDPCFPSKVAQAHVHNLLFHQHSEKRPLKYIFFPILTHIDSFVADTMDNASCPIVAGAPDVMKAAFTKEVDFFATRFRMDARDVIRELRAAGLDSIPGGGGEILVQRVRDIVAPKKAGADRWLEIMELAHLDCARWLLLTIPNGYEAGEIVAAAREKCPNIEIIARAHYDDEVDYITERGANQVVMGEREIATAMLDFAKTA